MKWYTVASWLTGNSACPKGEAEGETPTAAWVTGHRQCPPPLWVWRQQVQEPGLRVASDPLPRWLAWEWQDNAILQANPFSNQLTWHHDGTLGGIGLKPGFVLGWAGTNQVPWNTIVYCLSYQNQLWKFILGLCVTYCARARFKLWQQITQDLQSLELSFLHLLKDIIISHFVWKNELKRTKALGVIKVWNFDPVRNGKMLTKRALK